MNPDVKAKWLEALRSGEYEQGTGALHYDDKFCCLGVLCDISAKDGLTVSVAFTGDRWTYDGEAHVLPPSVRTWAGLNDHNPDIPWDNARGACSLAALNDGGKSFAEIADLIEEHL